ncbi:hypothetical protein A0H81_12770 [Grifola frondosa]|uniref:Uncharacterized protein n=1 Tax=Grifola frondosa TaxID=5627 RepID=A0A1C7LQY8_GRIFR|nr:hypothetical protein A0H81_12770 [Grifola frondosa]
MLPPHRHLALLRCHCRCRCCYHPHHPHTASSASLCVCYCVNQITSKHFPQLPRCFLELPISCSYHCVILCDQQAILLLVCSLLFKP